MRPLIQLTIHDINGTCFIALNLFNDQGQHSDQVVKPAGDFGLVEAVTDLLRIHKIDTVDVLTDNEFVFKTFLAVPGVNVSFVLPWELQALHELFMPDSTAYTMIRDLYLPIEAKVEPDEKVSLWNRFLNYLRGLIKPWKQ